MKALPLHQPWASLVAFGAKQIETRHYPPERVGLHVGQRVAIYAMKTLPPGGRRAFGGLCGDASFRRALVRGGLPEWWWQSGEAQLGAVLAQELPRGAVVCTCRILAADEMTIGSIAAVRGPERDFGFYEPGRWAWALGELDRLQTPIPATTSHPGPFDWPRKRREPTQGRLL